MASQSDTRAHAADVEVLVRRSMTKAYELFSLLTPPAYVAFVLARKGRGHLSINRFLRATWVGGAVGCVGGGGFEYIRSAKESGATLRNRRVRDAYDTASLRADDHATIGALLFAVLTPALLWKRASIQNLILGGAGIGTAVGLLTHYGRTVTGDPAPKIQITEISVSP
ncbi:hypothetical protein SCLCIDRAFT_1219784 [Scleroderma citrinum Foug A]|uniref:Uncharacterized protein n=1 Tax=Scleroderma citrinum Foug A TaxID=1036808 RepID=A0A0C3DM48_9AGAM|nr:hypothetical protein SCLCIDRAFT_1219784 [Scleroderma citrinum Foug A]